MLTSLRFVSGAIAKNTQVPALTHFCIENGRVRGYNGQIALCSPIPFDITCSPKAATLIAAIQNCEDTVALSLTKAGRLSVKSGSFKASIECLDDKMLCIEPQGPRLETDLTELVKAFKAIEPFVCTDPARMWSNGILLSGQSAFATNNIALVEYWTGIDFGKPVIIPHTAVLQVLRIKEYPISVQISDNNIAFHYTGDRWLRSQFLNGEWPDLQRVLGKPSLQVPIDDRLFPALRKLKPFCDSSNRIFLADGKVRTHESAEEGSSVELPDLQCQGIYNIEMLALLEAVAASVDWLQYPNPLLFNGERLRGAIMEMRS